MDYAVSKAKLDALQQKMEQLGIQKADFSEKFIRSQGKGGQKVNKTATCVYLTHLPTQITVKCQTSRSQSLNRFLAMRLLVDKVEELKLGKASSRGKLLEKIKKQKQKREKRAKNKREEGEGKGEELPLNRGNHEI